MKIEINYTELERYLLLVYRQVLTFHRVADDTVQVETAVRKFGLQFNVRLLITVQSIDKRFIVFKLQNNHWWLIKKKIYSVLREMILLHCDTGLEEGEVGENTYRLFVPKLLPVTPYKAFVEHAQEMGVHFQKESLILEVLA